MRGFVCVLVLGSLIGCQAPSQVSVGLSDDELSVLRDLDRAFAQAWLDGDSESVMSLMTNDAVIIPHHGDPPVSGSEAIRAFWWPPEGPAVQVTEFKSDPQEITGSGDLAWIRGRFTLAFTMEGENDPVEVVNSGNYLTIARKQADGAWLIARRIWNDPLPTIRTEESEPNE